MDPITHAALATAAGVAVARSGASLRAAALAGCVAGLLPDLDILLRAPGDPLAGFRWHRHFTHSFAFLPVIAASGALLVRAAFPSRVKGVRALMLPALAGGLSHILLDAATEYGTLLMWPFSAERTSWGFVPIIDPLFVTLPLLALAGTAAFRRSRTPALVALAWMTLYGAFAYTRKTAATEALFAQAQTLGHTPERVLVHPAPLSPILWRGMYETGGRLHTVGLRTGAGPVRIFPGDSVELLREDDPLCPRPGTVAGDTVATLRAFSRGWLSKTTLPDGRVAVGDARFCALPNGAEAIWGVTLDPTRPDETPAPLVRLREGARPYETFFAMLTDAAPSR